jgi:hypothetical protein
VTTENLRGKERNLKMKEQKEKKSFRRGGLRNVYFSYGRKPFYKPVFIIIVLITYPR